MPGCMKCNDVKKTEKDYYWYHGKIVLCNQCFDELSIISEIIMIFQGFKYLIQTRKK